MKHPLFQSYGLPDALTCRNQWAGWHRGCALPLALNEARDVVGWALPDCPATWCSFKQAMEVRHPWGLHGLCFMPSRFDPFLFITLHGAARGRKVVPSAARVLRACGTYAEICPEAADVTLVVEVPMPLVRQLGVRGKLPAETFPASFPVHEYDGPVTVWPAVFGIRLSGEFIRDYMQVRCVDPFALLG